MAWNGRNTAGTAQPNGKYKIIQTLVDHAANKLTNTLSVTLSRKHLVTHTSSMTLNGADYRAKGGDASGTPVSKAKSAYAHGVLLNATGGWAGVEYDFPTPGVIVWNYIKSIVYGRSTIGRQAIIGIYDPAAGVPTEVDRRLKFVGPAFGAWWTRGTTADVIHTSHAFDSGGLIYVEDIGGPVRFDVQVKMFFSYKLLE